jgi:hypothetical protein
MLPAPFCTSCLISCSHFPPAWFAVNMGTPDFHRIFPICDDFTRLLQVQVQFRQYLRCFHTDCIPAPVEHSALRFSS